MVKISDPFKGVVGDLQRLGIKRSRLESPGIDGFTQIFVFFDWETISGR